MLFPMIIHKLSGSGAATMDTGSAVFGMGPLLPDTGEPLRISPLNRQTGKSVRMPILEWGDFMNGVQSAVAELNEQTLGMDMEQKIKADS